MSHPLIELENVHVRFRAHGRTKRWPLLVRDRLISAVCGISLKLTPGESLAVVGESGSGKTSLARAMLGLLPIDRGTIRFQGAEIQGTADRTWQPYRRQMAILFQDPIGSLSPRMRVRDLLEEARTLARSGDKGASGDELLSRVGLSRSIAARYPHQLSGGQARRVGIARALARRPRLLVADEPTAGLDVSIQGEILELLRRACHDHQMSLLVITHDLGIVRHIADRLAVMYLGRWIEEGPATAVLDQPRHPYTRALLEAPSGSEAFQMVGDPPRLTDRPTGCEFHPRCPVGRPECRDQTPERATIGGVRSIRCLFPLE